MRRRDFIAGVGSATAWPLAARAQHDARVRRVGMLIGAADGDPQYLIWLAAFRDEMTKLGWIEGHNLRTELRFGIGDTDRTRNSAADLIAFAPDVILVSSSPAARAVRQLNQTIPIVFTTINDPVTTGLVGNLARPETNATGFSLAEPSIAEKWLELLKEAAPRVRRVAQLSDPASTPETYSAAIEAAARALAVPVTRILVRDVLDIVRAIDAFATEPDGGLLFPPDGTVSSHREIIYRLAVQHRLPAIYGAEYHARAGGLMSYGPDVVEQYRGAATYVDRILRGTQVSDLPVQLPTKIKLGINLKAAKAIGLTLPNTLLLSADEVIE